MKPLEQQTIVITGASSGIGLATARLAGERGARVVLIARDERDLKAAAAVVQNNGGKATHYVADVADLTALEQAAAHAQMMFGGIDTWVNNAGVTLYGEVERSKLEDMRRLFDVTYWGVVHGSLAALPYLKASNGALINVGSVESDVALPLSATYSAAKHAVKGFTDGLRAELEHQKSKVSVTLIKPASIDTPLFRHAKTYLEREPKPVPPVYTPEQVARAILKSAERGGRQRVVGVAGAGLIALERVAPKFTDWVLSRTTYQEQLGERRAPGRKDSLHEPQGGGQERGGHTST